MSGWKPLLTLASLVIFGGSAAVLLPNADPAMLPGDAGALQAPAVESSPAEDSARKARCAEAQDAAQLAWDNAMAAGTLEEDEESIAQIDRQVERFCGI